MAHIQLREEYYTMNLLQNLVILVFTDHNNNSSETKIN